MKKALFIIPLLIVGTFSLAQAATFKADETVRVTEQLNDDAFLSGERVEVTAPINGEVAIASNRVELKSKPSRSAFIAGDRITIEDGTGYNAFVAGNEITLKGTFEHDVYVAGNIITFDPNVVIKGSLRTAGAEVNLNGTVNGDIWFGADKITSNATINGAMSGQANTITFTGGKIGGNLTYGTNDQIVGQDKVAIGGQVIQKDYGWNRTTTTNEKVSSWLLGLLMTIVSGAAILLLTPRKVSELSETFRSNYANNLLTGVILFFLIPILAVLIMTLVVGLPIGIIALVVYLIALYSAWVISQIIVGDFLLSFTKPRRKNWWFALIVGVVILSGMMFIPVVGPIIGVLFFLGAVLPTLGGLFNWWRKVISGLAQ